MRVSLRSAVAVLLLSLWCGCDDDPEPEPGPFLSETPLWEVRSDRATPNACFGGDVAFADFDGDGRKDLAVITEACQLLLQGTQYMGRVSIFRGQERFFSQEAVSADLTWQNTNARTGGRRLRFAVGDVNGDAYSDLLVSGLYGTSVFLGQADLAAMLAAPSFRVPGNGSFYTSGFVDLDGDGHDDLVASRGVEQLIFRATPGSPEGLFTLSHRRDGFFSARFPGDLDGDGVEDVALTLDDGRLGYFLGCKPGSAFACNGIVSAEPWRIEALSGQYARFPDINGDGKEEAFASSESGPVQFHLSNPDGTFATTPVWSLQGDAAFTGIGSPTRALGDVDGDGRDHDFVMGAVGRLYFFSAPEAASAVLKPVWAWPRADTIPNGYETYRRYSVQPVGDLNGDGYADLAVASTAYGDIFEAPIGEVAIYGGGKVPDSPAPPPHAPTPRACDLALDPVNGKPDLTVDKDALMRTTHVVWKTFSADACEVKEQCVTAPGRRKLLRFSTSIQNLGSKAAILPSIEENPDMYYLDECHGHYHLLDFASYELRDASGQHVLSGRKQGFYLVDVQSYCSDAQRQDFTYDPMGISAGWADIYTLDTPCQWVDITDLPDGTYTFQVSVDDKDFVDEGTVYPNTVSFPVRLEGDAVTVLP
ncbi:FG-GAP-like repeat-containing protein [Myxococcus sp. K15C18031901]|uniref:lysyl oxidase family protein n=1 Tax=Myxococcus dinghuensis TaxID=2906761 RepID=UPI0020A78D59|nr:lysyl oxidase family protein [Myxococcus dinghuensis]MCP3102487.1 FG-GAP-like repeat-containing protein [Myxococcus dinghuensis]